MNRLTLELPTLLAEIDRFSEMGRQLRTSGSADGGSGSWILLGVLIAVVVAILSAWGLRQWWVTTPAYRMQLLFHGLCRTHEIQGSDRRRLTRLATANGLKNPAEVFVRPKLFEGSGGLENVHSKEWAALMRLRDRLFARRVDGSAA